MASRPSYLIIGAGAFGISTAYHLLRKHGPHVSVTVVDRDAYDSNNRVAASWDWNKVIRADYDDLVYCQLAIEAQNVFKSDPLWQPFFHETGVYWMCRGNYAQDVINNYKTLGKWSEFGIEALPVREARKRFGGLFEDADYTGVTEVLINQRSGWAAAGDCLRAVTRQVLDMGAAYVTEEVLDLVFDAQKMRCQGVKLKSGKTLEADHVVLCTGAYTAKLLEMSAASSGIDALRAKDRIVAGGITTGMTHLDDESYERFKLMPVGFQGYPADVSPFIGSLPPTKDRDLKWWGPTIFRNTTEVVPGRLVSAPPSNPDYAQWQVPGKLKEDVRHASRIFYGRKGAHWVMEKHRICWDAFTASGDFIISPHLDGLFIATCGSFHGFKFFPIIGKYILQMLEGNLSFELQERWAWDRERPDPALNPEWPRSEMNDLLDTTSRL